MGGFFLNIRVVLVAVKKSVCFLGESIYSTIREAIFLDWNFDNNIYKKYLGVGEYGECRNNRGYRERRRDCTRC